MPRQKNWRMRSSCARAKGSFFSLLLPKIPELDLVDVRLVKIRCNPLYTPPASPVIVEEGHCTGRGEECEKIVLCRRNTMEK